MIISGLQIHFNPGQTFDAGDPNASEPEKEKSRAEARADAIKGFQRAAQGATLPHIQQAVNNLLGLLIQFKAVGGSMAGDPLANQLREAAEFMEDLPDVEPPPSKKRRRA